ncbi:unnamed protein product, partial [Didymodactylos carnosus]
SMATRLEALCDELFIELYDYFDIVDLYYSFSNLNYRLNSILQDRRYLCLHSSLSLVPRQQFYYYFYFVLTQCYSSLKQLTLAETDDQGDSLRRCRVFLSVCNLEYFTQLRSLTLTRINLSELKLILTKLITLKQLTCLHLQTGEIKLESNRNDVCRLILCDLTQLKLCTLNFHTFIGFSELPTCSNIEKLTIERCFVNDFYSLMMHTPKLQCLNITLFKDKLVPVNDISNLSFSSNLVYLKLYLYYVPFDNIHQLRSESMPNLKTFILKGS